MDNQLTVFDSNSVASEITTYDSTMFAIFQYLHLPTENILVSVDERKKVFKNIEDVINILPNDSVSNSIYIYLSFYLQ